MRKFVHGAAGLAAALGLYAAGPAAASWDPRPLDEFVALGGSDLPPSRFEAGELGVLLPSYARTHLYSAWRAIVLGREGLRTHPATAGGLERALGSSTAGWEEPNNPELPLNQWLRARQAVTGQTEGPPRIGTSMQTADFGSYLNCPQAAFSFARDTLQALRQRPDATPQRLAAWVQGQDAVFNFCDTTSAKPPAPLAASEPLYWRQLRDYQVAAAQFYRGAWDESARSFAAIGATRGHPMQGWGAYLALRSRLRAATLAAGANGTASPQGSGDPAREPQAKVAAELLAQGQRILNDAALQPVHEATRATLRTLQYRLVPLQRFTQLTAALDDAAADPHADDRLGDWRRLANDFLDGVEVSKPSRLDTELRGRHRHFDWIRTLQRCAEADDRRQPGGVCAAERAHALAAWEAAARDAAAAPQQRAWLVAALLLSDSLTPALEKAALAVPATAPESLTVRHALVRLWRRGGQAERARPLADAALAELPPDAISATNLFRQERFALATSREDALKFLMRATAAQRDPDTGERSTGTSETRPAEDGLWWLNTRLAVTDLLALARNETLDKALRARVAVAAWLRADLLEARDPAEQASQLAERLAPAFAPVMSRYRQLPAGEQRRHWLVLHALSQGLSPLVADRDARASFWSAPLPPVNKDEVVASMWCSVGRNHRSSFDAVPDAAQRGTAPEVSADPAARDAEMQRLTALKTATGFVGDHVLGWARSHPEDPELPWLLYVVVQSTRGGCLDADASKTSKAAFQLLHQRYKNSPWTARTRVWY